MFEYDDDARRASETLDKYDFTDILSECYDIGMRDPWDILYKGILVRYPELEDTTDNLSTDEFMEYLCKKYHVRFEEIISYRMWYMLPNK